MKLDTCGCCEGDEASTPLSLENLPGKPALAYRAGTHATFVETMRVGLAQPEGLPGLTTRDDDDPAIALVDAWATVLDVLTFYQERIANEGFLRTATELRSVRELAREIGYEPGAGAAAATQLVFELETAPGAPDRSTIGVGVKVQSVPGQGELPQTFETVEGIEARPEWNAIPAALSRPVSPAFGARELFLEGADVTVAAGDLLLFVGNERLESSGSERWDVRPVQTVERLRDRDLTRVGWQEGLGWQLAGKRIEPAQRDLHVYVLRRRAALFGGNAPDWRAMPSTLQSQFGGGSDWPNLSIAKVGTGKSTTNPTSTIFLDALYPHVVAGTWIVLAIPTYVELYRVVTAVDDSRTDFTLTAKSTRLELSGENLGELFDKRLRDTTVFCESEQLELAETPIADPVQGDTIELADPVTPIPEGRVLLVRGRRARVRVADGERGLTLVPGGGETPVELSPGDVLDLDGPWRMTAAGDRAWRLRHESGAVGSVAADAHALVSVPAPPDAELLSEAAIAAAPPAGGEQEAVVLRAPLTNAYDRATARIAANVSRATHGESKSEILGSGDAAAPFQRFALKDGPLTYVPTSDSPSGAATTLSVRVNDVAWGEARALYGHGPRDRVYVVRTGEDGKATVEFGDGKQGARPPTGTENVRAAYRVGTGLGGQVDAGRLTLLGSPPLGVKTVSNPFAATGAADPESAAEARRQRTPHGSHLRPHRLAPGFRGLRRGVPRGRQGAGRAALGRRAEAGASVCRGRRRQPAPLRFGGLPRISHRRSPAPGIRGSRFGSIPTKHLRFRVAATLFVDPAYERAVVIDAVTGTLRDAFSFERRSFGQSVAESEIVAAMQRVDGVVALDMLALHLDRRGACRSHAAPGAASAPRRRFDPCRAAAHCRPGRDPGGRTMITKDDLYELLPVVTRLRDAEVGSPLERLIGVLAREADVLDRDIERLYDNWFIETCEAWVVPYIGDLLGVRPLFPVGPGTASERAYVANTIGYRRRKGTVGVLEQLAFDVTGWRARAVEFFELLGTTQYLNHLRPENVGTPDFRDGNGLDLLGGPFERVAHTAEVRRIPTRRGRYDIPNVGIFLWRLGSYPLERATAERIGAKIDGTWMFSPLGLDMPLFNRPEADRGIVDLAGETDVPAPLRRRAVRGAPDHYLAGTRPVLEVFTSAAATGPAPAGRSGEARGCRSPALAAAADPGTVGLDPVLGRLTFPAGEEPERVEASYAYGFSHDIGGGPYDRRLPTPAGWHRPASVAHRRRIQRPTSTPSPTQLLPGTPQPAGTVGTIAILDSRTYDESAAEPDPRRDPGREPPRDRRGGAHAPTRSCRPRGRRNRGSDRCARGAFNRRAAPRGLRRRSRRQPRPARDRRRDDGSRVGRGPGSRCSGPRGRERGACGRARACDLRRHLACGYRPDARRQGCDRRRRTRCTGRRGGDRSRDRRRGRARFGRCVPATRSSVELSSASRRQEGCVRFCFLPRNPATVATPLPLPARPGAAAPRPTPRRGRRDRRARGADVHVHGLRRSGLRAARHGCPPEISTGAEDGSEMGAFSTAEATPA